ncbi:hypothetical protein RCH09_003374 [Actimicrobium sp. GrIS 1.19]|uniref:hypothetical protein n=1 Tax=Actimicrobium sp. GrIS 1.19 TaxID=3071708 RepID=UPI002E037473|nr:hypothetical protein [Actimicrobium sp. GrIS 1.19]
MSWFDWFDDIFSGASSSDGGSGGGGGGGSFAHFALGEFAAQVPYIGPYLGFYLAGHEDLSELTNFPEPGERSSADSTGTDRLDRNEFGIDDGADHNLLRNPNLLAENAATKVSVEPWMNAPITPAWAGQEIMIDTGAPPRAQTQPAQAQPPPIDEVIVRGVRPDRSKASPPIQLPSSSHRAPYRPSESRPERQGPPRTETKAPEAQWTQEIFISAEPSPFDREESDPEALARAEGRGRIEWGDLVQLGRGGVNGLISAGQQLARIGLYGAAGQGLGPIQSPYAEEVIRSVDKYRLSIDPRYGGGGIIGEQLAENLAFEGLPLAPQLGKLASRALRSEHVVAPVFWFLGAGGMGGSSRASRALRLAARDTGPANRLVSISERAAGFRSVSDPSKTYVHLGDTPARTDQAWGRYQTEITGSSTESVIGIVDKNGNLVGTRQLDTSLTGLEGKVPEAKYGNMGQLYNPERYEHFVGQSQFLIDFARSSGRPGVEYRVSSQLGTARLYAVFTYLHPEQLRSGFLTVGWFPIF